MENNCASKGKKGVKCPKKEKKYKKKKVKFFLVWANGKPTVI